MISHLGSSAAAAFLVALPVAAQTPTPTPASSANALPAQYQTLPVIGTALNANQYQLLTLSPLSVYGRAGEGMKPGKNAAYDSTGETIDAGQPVPLPPQGTALPKPLSQQDVDRTVNSPEARKMQQVWRRANQKISLINTRERYEQFKLEQKSKLIRDIDTETQRSASGDRSADIETRRSAEKRRVARDLAARGRSQARIDRAMRNIDRRFDSELRREPSRMRQMDRNRSRLQRQVATLRTNVANLKQHAQAVRTWTEGGQRGRKPVRPPVRRVR